MPLDGKVMKICGTTSDTDVPAGDKHILIQSRTRVCEKNPKENKGTDKGEAKRKTIIKSTSSSSSWPSSPSSSSSLVPPRLCQRGLKCSENHLENLTLLHTYLKPHEAKQNDGGERLIGSGLVSAPFAGSLQENSRDTTHRTQVCCCGFSHEHGAHGEPRLGGGTAALLLLKVSTFKGRRDERKPRALSAGVRRLASQC